MPIATLAEIQEKIEHHYDDTVRSKDEAHLAAKFFVAMRSARAKGISWTKIEILFAIANTAMDEQGY